MWNLLYFSWHIMRNVAQETGHRRLAWGSKEMSHWTLIRHKKYTRNMKGQYAPRMSLTQRPIRIHYDWKHISVRACYTPPCTSRSADFPFVLPLLQKNTPAQSVMNMYDSAYTAWRQTSDRHCSCYEAGSCRSCPLVFISSWHREN